MEYAASQEGEVLVSAADAVLVEGTWYSDDLPDPLKTAMKGFRVASKGNRSEDGSGVLSAEVQQLLDEQRDALLDARRAYEVAAPSSESSKYEQEHAYGSMAFSQGRYANTQFEEMFRDRESVLASSIP